MYNKVGHSLVNSVAEVGTCPESSFRSASMLIAVAEPTAKQKITI